MKRVLSVLLALVMVLSLFSTVAFAGNETIATVTFNPNHGSVIADSAVEVECGGTVSAPAAPQRIGYSFAGWSTDPAGADLYDFSAPVYGDTALYAVWNEEAFMDAGTKIRIAGQIDLFGLDLKVDQAYNVTVTVYKGYEGFSSDEIAGIRIATNGVETIGTVDKTIDVGNVGIEAIRARLENGTIDTSVVDYDWVYNLMGLLLDSLAEQNITFTYNNKTSAYTLDQTVGNGYRTLHITADEVCFDDEWSALLGDAIQMVYNAEAAEEVSAFLAEDSYVRLGNEKRTLTTDVEVSLLDQTGEVELEQLMSALNGDIERTEALSIGNDSKAVLQINTGARLTVGKTTFTLNQPVRLTLNGLNIENKLISKLTRITEGGSDVELADYVGLISLIPSSAGTLAFTAEVNPEPEVLEDTISQAFVIRDDEIVFRGDLKDALNTANSDPGDLIQLNADYAEDVITLTGAIGATIETPLTLDLNGKTITCGSSQTINVAASHELTVINSSEDTARIINTKTNTSATYGALRAGGAGAVLNIGKADEKTGPIEVTGAGNAIVTANNTAALNIYGGSFSGNILQNKGKITVYGGLYTAEPTAYTAAGYEAVLLESGENAGKYQVGAVQASDITPAATNEGYDATYTASKTIVSTDGEEKVLAEEDTITVNVKAVETNEVTTDASIDKIDASALQSIVSDVLEAATITETTIDVEIEIVRNTPEVDTTNNTITYEVHPIATAYANDEPVGSVEIGNDALAENSSFTITLPVPDALVGESGKVKVTHVSADSNYGTETNCYDVQGTAGNCYVTFTVTHFSQFELEEATLENVVGTANFTASLSLEDAILINFYARNLKDGLGNVEADPSRFKVQYTFNGEMHEQTLTSAVENEIVVAACAAKELADLVTIKVFYNDELIREFTYSARQYCTGQIQKSSNTDLVNLCYALLNYGAAAQVRFNYNLENLANAGYEGGYFDYTSVPDSFPLSAERGAGVKSFGASLSLESKTELNVYFFTPAGNVEANLYQVYANGVEIPVVKAADDDMLRATVPGIVAAYLDQQIHIEIYYDGSLSSTLDYSPLTYAYRNQSRDPDGPVCIALYNYYLAAKAYFGI